MIYIMGFDYQGHVKDAKNKRFGFNNVFKDSRNYKKSTDEATYHGNWLNQTKRVLTDYPEIQFRRVIRKEAFKPHDLEFSANFKHLDIDEFLKIHNIQVQS